MRPLSGPVSLPLKSSPTTSSPNELKSVIENDRYVSLSVISITDANTSQRKYNYLKSLKLTDEYKAMSTSNRIKWLNVKWEIKEQELYDRGEGVRYFEDAAALMSLSESDSDESIQPLPRRRIAPTPINNGEGASDESVISITDNTNKHPVLLKCAVSPTHVFANQQLPQAYFSS